MVTKVRLKQKAKTKNQNQIKTKPKKPHKKQRKNQNQTKPNQTKPKTLNQNNQKKKSQENNPLLRGGMKSKHTKGHKEDGGWANPNNTLPKHLPGPSPVDTEKDTGKGQAGNQDKDLQGHRG